MILGAAYGIVEEGIMVRSFFSPTWKDLGLLATYGRWLGTNWVWAEWLMIYHAIFSITIPIFLVELTFPELKTRIWLSNNMRIVFHGLLLLSIILGFFAFPYDPGVLAIVGCIAGVVGLGWVAKKIPNISPVQRDFKISWLRLVLLGATVPAFFFFFFTSALIPFAIVTMAIGGLAVFGYERLLSHWAIRGFSDLQKLGLMTGALGFFAGFLDIVLEILGRLGTSVLGIAFVIYLFWLRKKIAVQHGMKQDLIRGSIQVPNSEPDLR